MVAARRVRLRSRFNSRAHEGRDFRLPRLDTIVSCFNSRAHEGRDAAKPVQIGACFVSIHAPTRGATQTHHIVIDVWSFNSRAHEGRDVLAGMEMANAIVSIHAPTRGATFATDVADDIQLVSIHAPTRGATAETRRRRIGEVRFNSRAHEGRDGEDKHTLRICDVSIHAPTRGATCSAVQPV
mgnify:CR=1 FL=1